VSDEHALGAELVTPEGARFSGAASGVVLRTADGDLTVLAGHTDLTGDVAPCVVRVERADRAEAFVVHGGFLRVVTEVGATVGLVEDATGDERRTRVTVLAGIAEALGDLDTERATAARSRLEAQLAGLSGDDGAAAEDRAEAEAALARATLRLDAAAGRTSVERQ